MRAPTDGDLREPWRARFETALWWAIALSVVTFTRADPDLFANVRFGLDLLAGGSIVGPERYAFTADGPFMNHEWLAGLVMAAAWSIGGQMGLVGLKVALMWATWWPISRVVRARAPSLVAVSPLLVVAALSTWGNNLRAQSFSFAAFGVVLLIMSRACAAPRWLAWLPIVFLGWANLHGGWLVGALALAAWAAAVVARTRAPSRVVMIAGVGAASFLATMVTPFGPEMLWFLRESVSFTRADIIDWQPIHRAGGAAAVTWLAAAALSLIAGARRGLPLSEAAPLLVLALASARVSRITAFFALAALAFALPKAVRLRSRATAADLTPVAAVVAMCAVVLIGGAVSLSNASCIRADAAWMPDRASVEALRLVPAGRVLPYFDWGHLVLWHRGGQLLVSIDGRRETVYGDALITRHSALYRGDVGAEAYPDALRVDYVWLPTRLPVVERLRAKGWHTLSTDPRATLLSREPILASSSASPLSTGRRCFPGP